MLQLDINKQRINMRTLKNLSEIAFLTLTITLAVLFTLNLAMQSPAAKQGISAHLQGK